MKKNHLKYAVREAHRIVRDYVSAISADTGGNLIRLPASACRIIGARLGYGIGPRYYSLYRLREVPKREWKDYVTDDPEFKQFLLARNDAERRSLVKNKLEFHRHCMEHNLPTIPILWLVADASELTVPGVDCVSTLAQWRLKMQAAPDEIFIKPIDGTHGEGAFVAHRAGEHVSFEGRSGSVDELFHYLKERLKHEHGWLVQPRMQPLAALAGTVSPLGLATIRAITHMRDGKAELLIAALKITVGDNVVDNFARGTTGNLLAGINRDTGELLDAWGSLDRNWPVMMRCSHHPDSDVRFKGTVLPFWEKLVQLACDAQCSLPSLQTLGWDIAATTEGLVLVEANAAYDVSILQIAHQRGLKREIRAALGESV